MASLVILRKRVSIGCKRCVNYSLQLSILTNWTDLPQLLHSSANCAKCRNPPLGNYFILRRLLIGLSRRADVLPDQLFLHGATCNDRDMVACGATGDIFRGSYQDAEVAMKRPRVAMYDSKSQKVGISTPCSSQAI